MRALGRRGPGVVPKQFKPLLLDERDRYSLWPSFETWFERASAGDIVAAYEVCRNPRVRHYMCYWIGRRELHAALPMLVHALNDPDSRVRGEAADSLGLVGDPSTGCDLFRRFEVEDDSGVRIWLAFALGATGYRPAISLLIEALAEAKPWVRHYAAQSLVVLGATEALPTLRQAYAEEANDWVKERMRLQIDELEGN